MGLLTDFFAADDQQLEATFVGWLKVAGAPIEREAVNPFTGEIQKVREWPTLETIGGGKPADIIDIRSLPHTELKNIDNLKIADLDTILTGAPDSETLDMAMKPALVHPTNNETGLHEIRPPLVAALRAVSEAGVDSAAAAWQKTEEMQYGHFTVDHCQTALRELVRLATEATPGQKMYLLWNL